MPTTHDYEMDLRKLGPVDEVKPYDGNKDGSLLLVVPDGSYVGEETLEQCEHPYDITGTEVDDGTLLVYITPVLSRGVSVYKS